MWYSLSGQLLVDLYHPCDTRLVGTLEAMVEVDKGIVLFNILVQCQQ